MSKRKDAILKELEVIKGRKDLLAAEDVVAWAADHPDSALHKQFMWDDNEAAREYRLWQARTLINLHVVSEPAVPRFVSLSVDRHKPGGGYRSVHDVMKSPKLRAVLLRDAVREFQRVQARYKHLSEFAKVSAEIDRVAAKIDPPKSKAA